MADFFISYTKANLGWAEWVAWTLEEAGYVTIIQAWDFRPGNNFAQAMDEASKKASRVIAILSPQYVESGFTQPEWWAAFSLDPTGIDGKLVPVRVEKCEFKGLLKSIIYIDLVGKYEPEAKLALLSGVKVGRCRPEQPPVFPGVKHQQGKVQPSFPGSDTESKQKTAPLFRSGSVFGRSLTQAVPRRLRVGSSVMHPQYGEGVVIEEPVGPEGPRARVRFTLGGERTFIVSKSPLRLIGP
jgi:hypothetical protein